MKGYHKKLSREQLIYLKSKGTLYNFICGTVASSYPFMVMTNSGTFRVFLGPGLNQANYVVGDKVFLFAQPMYQMGGHLGYFGHAVEITEEEFKRYQELVKPYIEKTWDGYESHYNKEEKE